MNRRRGWWDYGRCWPMHPFTFAAVMIVGGGVSVWLFG